MPSINRTGLPSGILFAASLAFAAPTAFADTAMGYLGLAGGQIARVNVVNLLPGQSCQAQLSFIDTSGAPVATGETMTLAPGGSTNFEVFGDAIASGGRTEVRPVVNLTPVEPCRKSALVSAEVVDSNQEVQVFWPQDPVWPGDPIIPSGPIRFGLIHAASGEVIRLTAANLWPVDPIFPQAPLKLRVRFIGADGQILSEQTATIAPGAASSFDLAGNGGAVRAEVSGIAPPGALPHRVLATGEVFNAVSGATTVAWPSDPIFPAAGIVNQ